MNRFTDEVYPFYMSTYQELANQPGSAAAKRYWAYVQTIGMFKDIPEQNIAEEFENLGWYVDKNRGLMYRRIGKEKYEQVAGYNPRGVAKRRKLAEERERILCGRGDLGS